MNHAPHPPTGAKGRVVSFDVTSATLLKLLVVGAALWLLIRLWPVLLVLVVALLLVGMLSPAVRWLEQRRVKRGLGIALVFSLLLIVATLAVTLTIPAFVAQTSELVAQAPAFRASLADQLARSNLTAPFADWLRSITYAAPVSAFGARAVAFSLRLLTLGAYGASALFLALYIMFDRDRLRGGLFAAVPRSHHIRLARVLMNLETIVGAFIVSASLRKSRARN